MRTPLIVTSDPVLLEELQRLAAAAGVVPEVAADAMAALRGWAAAPVVVVGADVAPDLARLGPRRRSRVHLLGWEAVPHDAWRLGMAIGAEDVSTLPESGSWLLEVLADATEGAAGDGTVLGVVGGSGGAGATTVACALGLAAGRRGSACLLDLDPLGPGVDRVLGRDRVDGVRWDALQRTTGRLSARALRESLPRRDGLGVLTWGAGAPTTMQPFAVREALAAAVRGHQVVVLDLPRGGDGFRAELLGRCDRVVVVVRAGVPGVAAAARAVAGLVGSAELGLLVRGGAVRAEEVEKAVGAPVLATVPEQRGLSEAVDLGLGPVRSRRSALWKAAEQVLDRVRADAPPEAA
jgi:secretion/DNA translocation related CpaE-like protein